MSDTSDSDEYQSAQSEISSDEEFYGQDDVVDLTEEVSHADDLPFLDEVSSLTLSEATVEKETPQQEQQNDSRAEADGDELEDLSVVQIATPSSPVTEIQASTPNLLQTEGDEQPQEEVHATTSSDSTNAKPIAPPRRKKKKKKEKMSQKYDEQQVESSEPTDEEILATVTIKCLDTGEVAPLSQADNLILRSSGPLALQMLQRTGDLPFDDDTTGDESQNSSTQSHTSKPRRRLTNMLHKAKDAASKAKRRLRNTTHSHSKRDDVQSTGSISELSGDFLKVTCHRDKSNLFHLSLHQHLSNIHAGAIWALKFSACGKLLATAGQDHVVRIWIVAKYRQEFLKSCPNSEAMTMEPGESDIIHPVPLCEFKGHTLDVLDLAWPSSHFLLSSSMDKTVRLWHISRSDSLASFTHKDFVTAISFHPKNDRYFVSGSMDGRLRLWSIPDKKVIIWNKIGAGGSDLITAISFCRDGQLIAVGTYDGRVFFYNANDKLKYHTQITLQSKKGRGKGRKVTGIQPSPDGKTLLITSNDSRLRLINLQDMTLQCKYRGTSIPHSQIRASFSSDQTFLICGSESRHIFFWETDRQEPVHHHSKRAWRRDRNDDAHKLSVFKQGVVTAATFAPSEASTPPFDDLVVVCNSLGDLKIITNIRQ